MEKRRRRRRSPEAPKKETMEKRTEVAEVTKEVNVPFYNMKGVERLKSMPDYTSLIPDNLVARTIAKYYFMEFDQLIKESKDKNSTVLEQEIIFLHLKARSKQPGSFHVAKYLHDRLEGKVKDRIEHSGPGGGPMQMQKVELDFDNMTIEEVEAMKKAHIISKKFTKDSDE